ncbi:MAG: hypothetical protein AAGH15_13075 [Myxococcota bacterium]
MSALRGALAVLAVVAGACEPASSADPAPATGYSADLACVDVARALRDTAQGLAREHAACTSDEECVARDLVLSCDGAPVRLGGAVAIARDAAPGFRAAFDAASDGACDSLAPCEVPGAARARVSRCVGGRCGLE